MPTLGNWKVFLAALAFDPAAKAPTLMTVDALDADMETAIAAAPRALRCCAAPSVSSPGTTGSGGQLRGSDRGHM